jgi:D-3-phosphoglycerate dehydrogenase
MSGFQMPMLVTDPYAAPQPGIEFVSLERLLKESDLVSVHVPLTDATRNLLGKAELRAMKPSAILVNTSRGGVIDESALVFALQERWISGAGLDVMAQEPLPLSSPLRDMDNVVLTPHYAGHSEDSMAGLRELVAGSVEAVLKGYWPPFPANPEIRPRVPLQPWNVFEETRAAGQGS